MPSAVSPYISTEQKYTDNGVVRCSPACGSRAAVSGTASVNRLLGRLMICPVGSVHGCQRTMHARYFGGRVNEVARAAGRERVREGVAIISSGTIQQVRENGARGPVGAKAARCEAHLVVASTR